MKKSLLEEQNTNLDQASKISFRQRDALRKKTGLSTKKSLALKQTAVRALLRKVAALRVPALPILKVSSSLCCNDGRKIHLLLKSETVSWQSIKLSRRRLRISLRGGSDCRFKSEKGC